MAGPLYLGGEDITTLIFQSSSFSSSSQLSIAGITCTADIQGRDLVATRDLHCDGNTMLNGTLTAGAATLSSLTPAGTNVLFALSRKQSTLTASSSLSISSSTASNASTMSGGLRISGGQGTLGTGVSLRLTGTGDSVNYPSGLYFGLASNDLHLTELS